MRMSFNNDSVVLTSGYQSSKGEMEWSVTNARQTAITNRGQEKVASGDGSEKGKIREAINRKKIPKSL
jgi:hypothetical protein